MWIVILLLLAIMIPVICYHGRQADQSHKDFSKGIINYNAGLTEFVYAVDKTGEEILRILNAHEGSSPLKYRFHEADLTIVFYPDLPDGSADIAYRISFASHNGRNILKVTAQTHVLSKNKYALYQNEFWHKTVGATPYPYLQLPM